jgi:hypothetical protein
MNNAIPVGLGGGGTMFAPQVSPHDPNLLFVACDMSGLYRSTDRGKTWLMCDARQVQSSGAQGATPATPFASPYGFSVAFHPDPAKSTRVVAFHTRTGLMVSDQAGDEGSWVPFLPALPLNGDGFPLRVIAAGFSRDFTPTTDSNLLLGTHDDAASAFGLYHLESGSWKPSTYVGGSAMNQRVIAFCFFHPSKSALYFCATVNDVLQSSDKGRTWSSIASPAGGALPPGFTVTGICTNVDSIFVTVATSAGTQGPYTYTVTAAAPHWTAMNSGLPLSAGYLYQFIASADDRDTLHPGTTTLFLTAVTPGINPPNVFRSTNGGAWAGVYYGVHRTGAPPPNVNPGWVDEAESPTRRGWGFGGPAWGFTVAPNNADVVVFTNQAVCDICENGTSPAIQWDNRYTQLTSGSGTQLTPNERWRSTGLDVTTVWKYFIHPTQPRFQFICYTDIGLARSDDGGQTWATIDLLNGSGGLWGNVYDLISDATGANLWAAVSDQHDIPHDKEINELNTPIGIGGVVTSTDGGITWTPYTNAGLASGPVISLVLANGVLYASVWGSGVYKSTPPSGGWTQVGTLTTGGPHPHCCRIDFADPATTDLYVVVAADTTGGGYVPGGLYQLLNAPTAPPAAGWTKLTTSLEGLITSLTPPGQRLLPLDFALNPFSSTEPGVHYLCTADGSGHGGGGIYKYNSGTGTWTALSAATKPFSTSYNDGLEAFTIYNFNGVRYATSSTHGTWFSADNGNNWQEYKASNFIRSQRILFPKLDATGMVAGDPSAAPFVVSTFGGSAILIPRGLFFILEAATVVKSSVAPGTPIQHAFYVVFENFLAAETGAGIQSSTAGLSYTQAPQITFVDTVTGSPIAGIQVNNNPALSIDDITLLTDTPQRFMFEYQLTFTNTAMFAASGSRAVTIRATLGPYACSSVLELLTDFVPSPQMQNGATSWLSDALRVFHVAEGGQPYLGGRTLTFTPGTDTPQAAALRFLGGLLNDLNATPSLFTNFSTSETSPQSTLYLNLSVTGVRQYNFAIARVQANSLATADANNVQVFFRLFTTAVSYTAYDPIHSYRRAQQLASTVETPLLGVEPPLAAGTTDVRIATIPCFGSPRLDYSRQSTAAQTDQLNQHKVPAGGTVFFGCWLDFNQLDPRYPLHPSDDGPFPAGAMKSVQELIRGNHQCLVAEIFSPQSDAIAVGTVPPAGLAALAQRNLSIDETTNPGESADSRTVSHTFEIGATPWNREESPVPDLLVIDWGNVPTNARATLFFPEVDAYASARVGISHSGSRRLTVVDAHTLGCVVGGNTFIPLVKTEPRRTPALVTVELPPGSEAGQIFRFVIRQVSGPPARRRVTGMFQFSIPVMKTPELLRNEERKLGVLRWIARPLVEGDAWTPVIAHYLERVTGRVRAFGGNPAMVPPSPYGGPTDGPPVDGIGCLPGWLVAIFRLLRLRKKSS